MWGKGVWYEILYKYADLGGKKSNFFKDFVLFQSHNMA